MVEVSAPRSATLAALISGFAEVKGQENIVVNGIAMDSRHVQPGDLFLACLGERARGHDYIAAAIEQGAAAIVYDAAVPVNIHSERVPLVPLPNLTKTAGIIAERFFGNPTNEMCVMGVTGTNGKTSCTHFIAQALSEGVAPCGIAGTLGAGLYGQLTAGLHTTPDAITLHTALAAMRTAGAKYVAMEVSSHGLAQGRVAGVKFDIAVFTNLSRDHLDYHGDMAAYGAAKRQLFMRPELKFAVINADDAFGRELLGKLAASVTPVAYGMGDMSDLSPTIDTVAGQLLSQDQNGLIMHVTTPWGSGRLESRLLGDFNAANLLAALSALIVAGVPFAQALQSLSHARAVPGRVETFTNEGQPAVVVDYAHTPDALAAVLRAVRKHCHGLLWCVFGCGGNRDRGKRPLMGAIAQRYADRIIVTDDNPRNEDPEQIVADICSGLTGEYRVIRDRTEAIAYAISCASEQDVIVVAGKGHENYQEIGQQRIPYSDRDTVCNFLSGVTS